jgi:sugar O-acyltransferase (sialic acid O-acetyltransferase NeuD family)
MKNLIIYGLSDFAKLMHHYFEGEKNYNFIGYCADHEYITSSVLNNKPVFSLDSIANLFNPEDTEIFVAVGYRSMLARESMFDKASCLPFKLASMISSKSNVDESATIGRNCVVFPGVQIEPNVSVAENCIIWSSSVLCHDSAINPHTFIAAQTVIGGRSVIGRRCFLGFNSTVIHDVVVGDDCLIGAKSLVTNEVPPRSKCIGIPAKVITIIGSEGVCVQ